MGLAFEKYEGLGNDFILIESTDESAVPPERAIELCDRHFGIGADGVLLVLPSSAPGCAARMHVINADGSIPEMCGNGIRCLALYLVRRRIKFDRVIRIETDAGERACTIDSAGDVTVDMGVVRVAGDTTVDVDGRSITLAMADAGNPHAVVFGSYAREDIERLGPKLATHASYPNGVNVGFANVSGDAIDLTVWERGVGITMACGTGACAALAVACDKGLAQRNRAHVVSLPGGELRVKVADDGRATMTGPARRVFSGTTV